MQEIDIVIAVSEKRADAPCKIMNVCSHFAFYFVDRQCERWARGEWTWLGEYTFRFIEIDKEWVQNDRLCHIFVSFSIFWYRILQPAIDFVWIVNHLLCCATQPKQFDQWKIDQLPVEQKQYIVDYKHGSNIDLIISCEKQWSKRYSLNTSTDCAVCASFTIVD